MMKKKVYIFYLFKFKLTIFEKSVLHFRGVFRVLLNIYFRKKAPSQKPDRLLNRPVHLRQSIQEWTTDILWKAVLKTFTQPTLEYFASFVFCKQVRVLFHQNCPESEKFFYIVIYIVLANHFSWKQYYYQKEVDLICFTSHYMKNVHIWIFSGLHFSAIGLNTDRVIVMQECRKIRIRKTSNMYTFHAALLNPFFLLFSSFMYDVEKWPDKPQGFSKYVRPIFILFESVDQEGMNFPMPFTMI